MNEPYTVAACRAILRDIGECTCSECIAYYVPLNRGLGVQLYDEPTTNLRELARQNSMTGAINFNLEMIGY